MSALPILSKALGKVFAPKKPRAKSDPDYGRFRALAKKHALKYRVDRDGFIEIEACSALPRGLTTAHYGWGETLMRVEHCISTPSAVDADGSYSE